MSIQSCYATPEQLQALSLTIAAYGRFTVNGLSPITAQLQAASSHCDMFLTEQFVLPILDWDMQLTKATCDIAAYNLYVQFGFNPNADVDKNIEMRYNNAIDWLKMVSRKELHPQYVDSSSGTPAAGPPTLSDPEVGFGGVGSGTWNNGGWNG